MQNFRTPSAVGPMALAVLAALVAWSAAPAAHAQAADAVQVTLAAQPLSAALTELARQTRTTLVASPALLAGKAAPAVSGQLTARQALDRLLAGSGLQARIDGSAITIQKAPESDASSDYSLREVRVSARRLGETEGTGSYTSDAITVGKTAQALREHPQTVSVITQQRLQDQNIVDLSRAAEQAPGVTVQDRNGYVAEIYSRGFKIESYQLDGGAPLDTGFAFSPSIAMAQYDRVEVLRGAAGLLNGTGNPGGAINLVRKMPTATPQFNFTASAGSWKNYRSEFDASGPLAFDGKLRGRAVLAYEDRGYFMDRRSSTKPFFYGVLEADLGPQATLAVGLRDQRNSEKGAFVGLPRWSTGADLGLPRHTGTVAEWSGVEGTSKEVFAKLTWRVADRWTLRANAAQARQTGENTDAFAFGAVDPLTGQGTVWQNGFTENRNRQTLLDVNLSGAFDAWGRTHELLVGADMQDISAMWQSRYRTDGNGSPANPWDLGSTPFLPAPYGPVESLYQPWGQKQHGLYGTLRLEVADGTKLIVGARANRYKYSQRYEQLDTDTGVWSTAGDTRYSEPTKITPFAGLVHDLGPQWSAYASYAQIFRPQADFKAGPAPGTGLKPMRGTNLELGLKGELLDGKLHSAFALYRIVQDGRAVEDPRFDGEDMVHSTKCCYLASGKVVSQGLDMEVSGEVARGVQLLAGYTYNHNRDKTQNAGFSTITPRHLLKLWGTWHLPGAASAWQLGAGATIQSTQYVSGSASTYNPDSGRFNGPSVPFRYTQSGYAVWNAMVQYRIDPRWTVTMNLNNLFDKWYYRTVGSSRSGNYYGEPRNVMLTLRGRF